jgi:ParB family chromosome partitioning protein
LARSSRAPISFEAATAVAFARDAIQDRLAHSLSVSAIQPSKRNPRQHMDNIAELADSLREHGLLQPVVVRRRGTGYELIAGHRRLEAARLLGWCEIAAVVRDETDEQAYILTLVENLQREDLSPKEEASALEVLVRERGWTTRQVGEAIKRSPMYVSRRLRVFDDDEVLKPLVLRADNPLSVSTAEELLREPDASARRELAQRAVLQQWTPSIARREVAAGRGGCNGTLQAAGPRLASRIRSLTVELAALERASLSLRTRRDLARLIEVAQRL